MRSRALLLAPAIALVLGVSAPAQCSSRVWSAGALPGNALDHWVWCLGVHAGELYAGGNFGAAGSVPLNGIAKWTGSAWVPLAAGTDGAVFALESYGGELVAGGYFAMAGTTPANGIARWNGSAWLPLGSGVSSGVHALIVFNGDLIAGGYFSTAGGIAAANVARWNGVAWAPMGAGFLFGVNAFCIFNGTLIAAGDFFGSVAQWNGSAWQPIGAGLPGVGYDLAVFNGEIVAAGTHLTTPPIVTSIGDVHRWNGSSWIPFGGPLSAWQVQTLAVFDNQLIAGGGFGGLGGPEPSRIAAWDGSAWLHLGAGLDEQVEAVVEHDGALIAGGLFQGSGSLPTPHVARWSSPQPLLAFSQPGGPGTGIVVTSSQLLLGHEYFSVVSLDLCSNGPGTGPYGGLCIQDPTFVLLQLQLPLGSAPFHILSTGTTLSFGPYLLPAGLSFDAGSADVTGGVLGCISPIVRFTVP